MAEPTIPVPVSLIERIVGADSRRTLDKSYAIRELRALLSQPTPTAKADEWIDGYGFPPPHLRGKPLPAKEASIRDRGTTPPSIADMAPGTTFEHEGERWKVLHDGLVMCEHGGHRNISGFDPSTIRDVTPPKETP